MQVVRLLIYEGSPEWINTTLSKNSVPEGIKRIQKDTSISSMTLGSVPDIISLSLSEKPKHSYEDLQEKLREYELELIEYSCLGSGDPETWDEITENYRKCQKEFLTMLKEVCDAGS